MKIAIINSNGFWAMGWATDKKSQQDVIGSLHRLGIEVAVFEVGSKAQLDNVLESLKGGEWLLWPNAYQVYACEGSSQTLWLADIIDEYKIPMIGSNANALKNVMAKDKCQQLLQAQGVPIPVFASIDHAMLAELEYIVETRELEFPLFVKPNDLSTSKGITQDSVVKNIAALRRQITLVGDEHGYPVMVEEYLPGRDITVAVFMTEQQPTILATYYDTAIYDDPGAVLDYEIRMRDWNDGKWLSVVNDPQMLAKIRTVAIPACQAVGITEFTRIDCRLDSKGRLKVFDVNGLPGLELPFSTTVWQMIVKMNAHSELHAFDTLISLVVHCSALRHKKVVPAKVTQLVQQYIEQQSECLA